MRVWIWEHPQLEPQDPEQRIAELEQQLAEAKSEADREVRAARDGSPGVGQSYVKLNPIAGEFVPPAETYEAPLAAAPRKVPASFRLAEVLPFRWWYVWVLFMLAVAPIVLWLAYPVAFAAVAVLALLAIYGFQFRAARTRLALLKWGQVATVTGTEMLSRGTYYSGTTW
jgi:hypothetical protein